LARVVEEYVRADLSPQFSHRQSVLVQSEVVEVVAVLEAVPEGESRFLAADNGPRASDEVTTAAKVGQRLSASAAPASLLDNVRMSTFEVFSETSLNPPVRGFLHRPESPSGNFVVLTHGAGGNAQMALLQALAAQFAGAGLVVLRCDLPFRQVRRFGPPRPGDAGRDRLGLRNAVDAVRKFASGKAFLGGQSYGGRQASMLLAEEKIAEGLLLLSYPLHAPGHPEKPRIEHLPKLHVPALFVHGTRDPFGTIDEIENARKLIPAKTELLVIDGAGHDLGFKGKTKDEVLPGRVLAAWKGLAGLGAQ